MGVFHSYEIKHLFLDDRNPDDELSEGVAYQFHGTNAPDKPVELVPYDDINLDACEHCAAYRSFCSNISCLIGGDQHIFRELVADGDTFVSVTTTGEEKQESSEPFFTEQRWINPSSQIQYIYPATKKQIDDVETAWNTFLKSVECATLAVDVFSAKTQLLLDIQSSPCDREQIKRSAEEIEKAREDELREMALHPEFKNGRWVHPMSGITYIEPAMDHEIGLFEREWIKFLRGVSENKKMSFIRPYYAKIVEAIKRSPVDQEDTIERATIRFERREAEIKGVEWKPKRKRSKKEIAEPTPDPKEEQAEPIAEPTPDHMDELQEADEAPYFKEPSWRNRSSNILYSYPATKSQIDEFEKEWSQYLEDLKQASTVKEVYEALKRIREVIQWAPVDRTITDNQAAIAAERRGRDVKDAEQEKPKRKRSGKAKDEPAQPKPEPIKYEEIKEPTEEPTQRKTEPTREEQRRTIWADALRELERAARRADELEAEAKKKAREAAKHARALKQQILEMVALGPENYQGKPLLEIAEQAAA